MLAQNNAQRLSKSQKKSILKKLTIFNGLLLIAQIIFSSLFFVALPKDHTQATASELCPVAADVVLVIDRSGSMGDSSRCDWWKLECINKPSCSLGYEWIKSTTYNQTQSWCASKNNSAPHESVWTEYNPTKITAAKTAANNFINSMGPGDQSALITFANTATLDKGLSSDHALTKTAVNNITVTGATNIGDAISLGAQELGSTRSNPKANHAMILLTDGKANKPTGPGYGEYAPDVAYALAKANQAAALGYKIFTIGLGTDGEINETMLQNIAQNTGASYYHSPNTTDLQTIYDSIATQICQYGSISGCVYNDQNNNNAIDAGEPALSGWDIRLTNGSITLTQTLTNGCYTFAGLEDDTYTVSEITQPGWLQTYPSGDTHTVAISGHNDLVEKNFANYFPTCGNDLLDPGETCELGATQACTTNDDYPGIQGCDSTCTGWSTCANQESCGDGVKNGSEQCDGTDGVTEHYQCTASCTLEYLPWCGDQTINNTEECDGDAPKSCLTTSGYTGTQSCAQCSWGSCQTTESCGDQIINGGELCDSGTQACVTTDGYSGTQSCNQSCAGWNTCQTTESCGDGLKNGAEQCDDHNIQNNDGCSATCQIESAPVCGNGTVESGEACDNGPSNGHHAACSASCALNPACDDGQDNDADSLADQNDPGCFANSTDPSTYDPTDDNETDQTPPSPVCGNELLESGETCDDGNTQNGDGCSSQCTTESGGSADGSLTVYKYLDADGDLATTNDQTLATTTNWTFSAESNVSTVTATSQNGQAHFAQLAPGTYHITEQELAGWYLVGANPTNQSVTIASNQNSTITFYNAAYAVISGYVFEDLDGATSTTADIIARSGRQINLFNATATSTPTATTTTDVSGYFEFKNLLPGSYRLTESLPTGWQSLILPADPIVVINGQHAINNNFISYQLGGSGGPEPYCGDNIKNNNEQCDGSDGVTAGYTCDNACVLVVQSSGGGGGFTASPKTEITYTHYPEKNIHYTYSESVTVHNTGNIVLTNGVLTLDLPENSLEFLSATPAWSNLDPINQVAQWSIPALGPANTFTVNFSFKTKNSNPAATTFANIIFPSAQASASFSENISNNSTTTGGSPITAGDTDDHRAGQSADTRTAPKKLAVSPASSVNDTTPSDSNPGSGLTAGEQNNEPTPNVLGVSTCAHCPWWTWPLLAVLHLAILIFYLLAVSPEKTTAVSEQSAKTVKGHWWWTLPTLLLSAVIFFLLLSLCKINWLPLSVVMASFYLILISFYALLKNNQSALAKLVTIVFLTMAPIATYLNCPWNKPLIWAIAILPYVITLALYSANALKLTQSKYTFWGWFIFSASAFTMILEWLLQHCQCL